MDREKSRAENNNFLQQNNEINQHFPSIIEEDPSKEENENDFESEILSESNDYEEN